VGFFEFIFYLYLGIGLLVGGYQLLFGWDSWYWFIVNVVGGPIYVVVQLLKRWQFKHLQSQFSKDVAKRIKKIEKERKEAGQNV